METVVETANWIADQNRFNLPKPPQWALVMLREFDPMLVVIPSRHDRAYLLTRRRQFSAGLGDVAMLDNKHPDTNMCYGHHVVPIAPIESKTGAFMWEQTAVKQMLDALKARDTWALSGGPTGDPAKIWEHVEAKEDAEKAQRRRNLWDSMHHRGRDAWRSLKARTGQRSKRAGDYHGVARLPKKTVSST